MNNDIQTTELWLKSIFNINAEIDAERDRVKYSLERIEKLEKEKENIFNIISAIENPTYKAILHKRYVQGKRWDEISREINYEKQHVHRLHKNAIRDVHNIRQGQK